MLIFCVSRVLSVRARGNERNVFTVRSPSLDGVRVLILGGDYIVRMLNEDKSKKGMDNSILDIIRH